MPGSMEQPVYSPVARFLHWLSVALILGLVPVGLYMSYRGGTLNIWDGVTNGLYSAHKLAGFTLLWVVVIRLVYRLAKGAPPDEPTIEPWQAKTAHLTHLALYVLLIAAPLAGWLGVSLYPALDVFGLFNLPGLVAPSEPQAATAFAVHKLLVFGLCGLIALHIGGALFHRLIRKDGVMRRMWPSRG